MHPTFVPWKCPVCPADILSNLCGTTHKSSRDVPDVLGLAPRPSPGHFRGIPAAKFLYVSGLQKGPAERGHVKKRQKPAKSVKKFSTLFDNLCAGQKTSKIVKKRQNVFRHFSTILRGTNFPAPFGGLWLRFQDSLWEKLPRKAHVCRGAGQERMCVCVCVCYAKTKKNIAFPVGFACFSPNSSGGHYIKSA